MLAAEHQVHRVAGFDLLQQRAHLIEVAEGEAADLRQEVQDDPTRYAPWLAGVLSVWSQSAGEEPVGER